MKTLILLIISIVFLKLNFFAQEKPKSKKEISFGIVPYELFGRRSGSMLLFEGERFSYGFAASYLFATRYNGGYLTPYRQDRFFFEGLLCDFMFGFGNFDNSSHYYFNIGPHFLYYDFAAVTNGKVGDEIGYTKYINGQKVGGHFSFLYIHKLTENGRIRFFARPSFYLSYFERTFSGNYLSKSNPPPQYQAKPAFESGVKAEIGVSLGLFLNVKFRDNSKKAITK
jgi:hypothetical protein